MDALESSALSEDDIGKFFYSALYRDRDSILEIPIIKTYVFTGTEQGNHIFMDAEYYLYEKENTSNKYVGKVKGAAFKAGELNFLHDINTLSNNLVHLTERNKRRINSVE